MLAVICPVALTLDKLYFYSSCRFSEQWGRKGTRKNTKATFDLKADDVSVRVGDLLHDAFLPVLPVEGPGRTVAVQLPRGVFVTQHVVAHDREGGCRCEQTWEDTKGFLFSPSLTHSYFPHTRSPKTENPVRKTKHALLLHGDI